MKTDHNKSNNISDRVDHIIVSSAGGVLFGAVIAASLFPVIGAVPAAGIGAITFGVVDFLYSACKTKEK